MPIKGYVIDEGNRFIRHIKERFKFYFSDHNVISYISIFNR